MKLNWLSELNSELEWELVDSAVGATPIALPTNYNELQIIVKGLSGTYQLFTFTLPKEAMNDVIGNELMYLFGGADATAVGGSAISVSVGVTKDSISLASYWYNNTSLKDTATTYVYYR